jgi:hypothetical protein
VGVHVYVCTCAHMHMCNVELEFINILDHAWNIPLCNFSMTDLVLHVGGIALMSDPVESKSPLRDVS